MDARPMTIETPIDTIGIIGAGHAGQAFARVALRAGRKVRIANSRGLQSLGPVVLGPRGPWAPWSLGPVEEALGPARRPADR